MGTIISIMKFVGRIVVLVSVPWLLANIALAVSTSNWVGSGSDFNTATNWDSGVPTDVAGFNSASPTSINLSAGASLNSFTFNSGASAYTINANSQNMSINGAGIVNNSNNTQTFTTTGGQIAFTNSASAGNAVFNASNIGSLDFFNSSSAGSATINLNRGEIQFNQTSSAGTATITVTNSGSVAFTGTSDASNAAIINNSSGQVNLSGATSGTTIGWLSGAGDVVSRRSYLRNLDGGRGRAQSERNDFRCHQRPKGLLQKWAAAF